MGRLVGNLGFVLLLCLRNVNALLAKKKEEKKRTLMPVWKSCGIQIVIHSFDRYIDRYASSLQQDQ